MGDRGFFGSIGAGLCLVIAGVLVLVVASSVVAFNGWPGMRESADVADLRLPAQAPPVREAGATAVPDQAQVAVRLRPAPSRRRQTPAAGSRREVAAAYAREHTRTRTPAGSAPQSPATATPVGESPRVIAPAATPVVVVDPPSLPPVVTDVQTTVDALTTPAADAVDAVGKAADDLLKP